MRGKTWRLTPRGDLVVALAILLVGLIVAIVFWDDTAASVGFMGMGATLSVIYMGRAERKRMERVIESLRAQAEWDSITINKLRQSLYFARGIDV